MTHRNLITVSVITGILIFDIFVYNHSLNCDNSSLPRCFPTGEIYPFKDSNGNIKYDSVYHRISNFKLTDQNANTLTNDSLKDKVHVANFFFCSCRSICPRMTNYMLLVQKEFRNDKRVALLSYTVDPEHDSVAALKKYAEENHIDGRQWHLLTGTRNELYDLSKNSYFLSVGSAGPDNFEHSEKFVLVDADMIIRGYYNGTDSVEVEKLKSDIRTLLIQRPAKTLL
jgi:protein SCO1/2